MITFERFKQLARNYNVVPLEYSAMADLNTPVSAYLALREPGVASFLLETVEPDEKIGRYSFIGLNPLTTVRARGNVVTVENETGITPSTKNIFETLAELSASYRQAGPEVNDGFLGGFVGYLGYDTVSQLEQIAQRPSGTHAEDDAVFGLFTSVVRFDHRSHLMTIVHNVVVDELEDLRRLYDRGKNVLETLELRLRRTPVSSNNFQCDFSGARESSTSGGFCDAVRRAKEHIFEGDIFQVVLSRNVRIPFSGDPFPIYRALRTINPSPYLFYIDFGETKLVGSSPEVLVKVRNGTVEVFPIAGTRPRGATAEEDSSLERELAADAKELAEHVMLVDLGRNDVGRISEYGSVSVPVFKRVERYSHVMHLVSEVRGQLKRGATPLDALKACFPAGTVTGAPKVRAMEIISELEPEHRGAYAGAVGYLGLNGSLDTCIAIRTIIAHGDTLTIQAGAGIVADSEPINEYQETVNKARALLDAVKLASDGLSPSSLKQNRRRV